MQLQGIADPNGYDPFLSFKLLAAVLLGGMTSAIGAVAGLAGLSGLTQLSHWIGSLEGLSAARFDPMLFAILVLVVLGFGGAGIVPWAQRLLGLDRSRQATAGAVAAPVPRGGATLSAEGVRKRFGGVVALDGLELEAHPEAIVALIGPNGSGKTTALRILSGTLHPDGGRVELDGHELNGDGIAGRVERGIVRTLQRTAVFEDMTALENVLAGAGVRRHFGGALRTVLATPKSRAEDRELRSRALATLELVELTDTGGRRAGTLSASEQRRLMLASALATDPRILLLDEISAGGTAEDVRRLAGILERLRSEGLAIVLVEHNLRLVRDVASSVVVLDYGQDHRRGSAGRGGRAPAGTSGLSGQAPSLNSARCGELYPPRRARRTWRPVAEVPSSENQTLTIGVNGSFSKTPYLADTIANGTKLAALELPNGNSFTAGGHNYTVKVVKYDNGGSPPPRSRTSARRSRRTRSRSWTRGRASTRPGRSRTRRTSRSGSSTRAAIGLVDPADTAERLPHRSHRPRRRLPARRVPDPERR